MPAIDTPPRSPLRATLDAAIVLGIAYAIVFAMLAPTIATGRIPAVGDGLIETYPAFSAPFDLWNADMLLGYPVYADPNMMVFYPMRLLCFVPAGFTLFVASAYAIAGAALFGYVIAVTHSRIAAAASSLAFSFGGFAISHFGHPMIAHPMAWTIVALWTLQRHLDTRDRGWLVALAIAVAISLTAGQPQVVLFGLVLLTAYALALIVPSRSIAAFADAAGSIGAIFLGVALGSPAWLPAVAFARESTRASLTYGAFVQDSLPVEHLATWLTFPFVYGTGSQAILGGALLDSPVGSATEAAAYVPLAALALVPVAFFWRPRRYVVFWVATLVIAFALAIGDEIKPLATATYLMFPFNSFRIPGRHAFELTLAASVLAGLGISSADRVTRPFTPRRLATIGGLVLATALCAAAVVTVQREAPQTLGRPHIAWFLCADLVSLTLCSAALFLRSATARRTIFGSAVALGAILFGATSYANDGATERAIRPPLTIVAALRNLPIQDGQRMYVFVPESRLRPNLTRLQKIPDVSGYTPLQPAAIRHFLGISSGGRLFDPSTEAIDLSAIRYLAVPSELPSATTVAAPFIQADLGIFLARDAPETNASITLGSSIPVLSDRIDIVSSLGNSTAIAQGANVARLVIHTDGKASQTIVLRAGIETAETAYDVPGVGPIHHARAQVFTENASASWYVASLPLPARESVRSITIDAISSASLNVRKLSLVDASAGTVHALGPTATFFAQPNHFSKRADVSGVTIFENMRALPRTWVTELASPRRLPSALGTVLAFRLDSEHHTYRVRCDVPCTLNFSDAWNVDWLANIDGEHAPLRSVHEALGAIDLPVGEHRIDLHYRPHLLITSIEVAGVCAALLALAVVAPRRRSIRSM